MKRNHAREIKCLFVVCIICILWVCSLAINSEAADFKFAVWGDSQFHNPKIFDRIVKETELLKPAFVIHVGDMILG